LALANILVRETIAFEKTFKSNIVEPLTAAMIKREKDNYVLLIAAASITSAQAIDAL
jgi:hypothetical protein